MGNQLQGVRRALGFVVTDQSFHKELHVSTLFATPPYVRIEGCYTSPCTPTRRTIEPPNTSCFQSKSSPLSLPRQWWIWSYHVNFSLESSLGLQSSTGICLRGAFCHETPNPALLENRTAGGWLEEPRPPTFSANRFVRQRL